MGASVEYQITLRSVKFADLPLLLAWRSDKEITQYMPVARDERLTWKEHYRYWNTVGHRDWMIIIKERPVGIVHILPATGEVGIIIGEKTLWGKGIATEALRLMLELVAKNQLTHKLIWAAIHPENIASQKTFTKAGFVNTHELVQEGQERWVLK